jgi:hypothetical protein
MPKPLAFPAYQIPLTDEQFILFGRISAAWSQIEYHLEHIVCRVHGISFTQLELFSKGIMMSGKIDFLAAALQQVEPPSAKVLATELVAELKNLVSDRNVMTHGLWGYWTDGPTPSMPAAYSNKRKQRPLVAIDLMRIHNKTMVITWLSADLLAEIKGAAKPNREGSNKHFFGETQPDKQQPKSSRRLRAAHRSLD